MKMRFYDAEQGSLDDLARTLDIPEWVLKRLLDHDPPRGAWEGVVRDLGRKLARRERVEEPIELEPEDLEGTTESGEALCRIGNEWEFRTSVGGEEEEEDYEEEEGFIEGYPGMTNIPDDICKPGRMVGSIHSHPDYPARPSDPDVKWAVEHEETIMCIDSPASRICWFADKPSDLGFIPNKGHDPIAPCSIGVRGTWFDEWGGAYSETWNINPPEFIESYDEEEFEQSGDAVKEGDLRAVCRIDSRFAECIYRSGDKVRGFSRKR